jgi:hypothetical protein
MNRSDAANRLERLLRRDLDEAAREAGPPSADEIDAYVAGRASAAEREVIESWLSEDAALQQEVDALMAMRQTIESEAGPAAAPARKSSPSVQARPAAHGSLQATAQEMRSRPMRTAAMLAVAASLAFFLLWVVSPGRPPVESELASGGAATGGGSAAPGTASSGAASSAAAPVATLTLRDAGGEVSLLANGDLRGLDGLDVSHRSAVQFALAKGRLEILPQIDALASSASTLRAPGAGDAAAPPSLRVVRPLATTVRTRRPTFEWTSIPGASSYRVRIANTKLDPIVESPKLTATTWTPEAPLPMGLVLTWQVEAQTPQGSIVAPAPPAAEARILVLRTQDVEALRRELNAAPNSDLAAAVALARFGVLDEADAALARLATANRDADAIVRLRRQLSDRRFPR